MGKDCASLTEPTPHVYAHKSIVSIRVMPSFPEALKTWHERSIASIALPVGSLVIVADRLAYVMVERATPVRQAHALPMRAAASLPPVAMTRHA